MAEAVVSFVVERVGDLLIREAISLGRLKGQVEEMQRELKHMMNFLKDADKRQHKEERVKGWISDIRELAYDVEDVIETYALEVASRSQPGFRNNCKRYASIFIEAARIYKVGSDIAALKTRITNLTGNLQRYNIRFKAEGVASSSSVSELRWTYSHVVEEDTVGLERNTEDLVRQLVAEEKKGEVISICGMGGLGKTTLAKKVYHHDEVRRHFDGFAWACISQQFQPRDIWEGILIELVAPSERQRIRNMRREELSKELCRLQEGKKCLVILDDIWSEVAWDTLKPAFPTGNTSNSKIILTTRIKTVALHVNLRGILEPQCLTKDESWKLLQKKAFPGNDCTGLRINREMENLGMKMVERCAGLPLMINVLGGVLQTRDSIDEWRSVHENIDSCLRRGNQHDQEPSREHGILALSYHELPYFLKPCFLYLSHFQEDEEIRTKNLFRLWVAEGFISQHEVETNKTMEDVAESYMHKLINRSMVQVGKIGRSGKVKTCRMHDLMRDLCLSEANKESFFKNVVYDGNRQVVSPEVRRLAVYADQHFEYPRDFELTPKIRSFFLISKRVHGEKPLISRINCFKLLRTLTLTRCRFKDGECKEIGFLIHLRYLTIIKCGLRSLPSSIGNLRYLQTLFIDDGLETVPNVIWKLEQLRHVVLLFEIKKKCQKLVQLGNLRNLQTLQGFDTKVFDMNELVKLTNLKKLGIKCTKEDLRVFEPQRLSFNSLSSLILTFSFELFIEETDFSVIQKTDVIEETDLEHVFTCCHHLCKLHLYGKLRKLPEHPHFPPNLTKLTLARCHLKEDPMATLEKLPKLEYLCLGYDVSDAREIVCSSKGFPQLKTLLLFGFSTPGVDDDMLEWRVEEEAMPNLCHLRIHYCRNLKMIPDGLRFITTLHELVIERMPPEFVRRLQVVDGEGGEDHYKVQHVPSIIIRIIWYLSIVKDEGLEISQPALDPVKSWVHHLITARVRKSRVHSMKCTFGIKVCISLHYWLNPFLVYFLNRRIYKLKGSGRCDENNTAPPCIGWVETMAPVFSRTAWQCAWHMILNDLIHPWGLDMQLGYCAQGDRSKNVSVVDSEYIVHLGLPTLGVLDDNEAPSESHRVDNRSAIFKKRWNKAAKEDECWVDPYQHTTNNSNH